MKLTFPMALLLLFIALKLTGHIDWSWWWVTAPAWAPLAICAPIFVVISILAVIVNYFETPEERAARALRDLARKIGKK